MHQGGRRSVSVVVRVAHSPGAPSSQLCAVLILQYVPPVREDFLRA